MKPGLAQGLAVPASLVAPVTIKLFDSNILVLVSRLSSLKTGTLFFPPSCRLQSSNSLQQVKTNYWNSHSSNVTSLYIHDVIKPQSIKSDLDKHLCHNVFVRYYNNDNKR